MTDLKKEILETIKKIKDKAEKKIEMSEDDMQFLLLTSLMEEDQNVRL